MDDCIGPANTARQWFLQPNIPTTWTRETVAKDLRSEQAVPHLGSYVVRTPEHREWLTPDVKQGLSLAELRSLGFGK